MRLSLGVLSTLLLGMFFVSRGRSQDPISERDNMPEQVDSYRNAQTQDPGIESQTNSPQQSSNPTLSAQSLNDVFVGAESRDTRGALELLKNAALVAIDQGNDEGLSQALASAFYRCKQLNVVDECLSFFRSLDSTAAAYEVGLTLSQHGYLNESLEFLEAAIPYKPRITYQTLASVHFQLGNTERAIDAYEKIIEGLQMALPARHDDEDRFFVGTEEILKQKHYLTDDLIRIGEFERAQEMLDDLRQLIQETGLMRRIDLNDLQHRITARTSGAG